MSRAVTVANVVVKVVVVLKEVVVENAVDVSRLVTYTAFQTVDNVPLLLATT